MAHVNVRPLLNTSRSKTANAVKSAVLVDMARILASRIHVANDVSASLEESGANIGLMVRALLCIQPLLFTFSSCLSSPYKIRSFVSPLYASQYHFCRLSHDICLTQEDLRYLLEARRESRGRGGFQQVKRCLHLQHRLLSRAFNDNLCVPLHARFSSDLSFDCFRTSDSSSDTAWSEGTASPVFTFCLQQ